MLKKELKIFEQQEKALDYLDDDKTSEILYGGGAGGGKTRLGCLWIIKNCLKYKGSRWCIGRNKLKLLKQTTLVTFFDVCKDLGLKSGVDYVHNQQESEITFKKTGSVVILKDLFLYPTDPEFDSLGSLEICGYFIDECNQVVFKAVDVIRTRCRYKLDEFGIIPKGFLSCNPAKNWVYKQYYKPSINGTLQKDRKFIQALAKHNPFLPQSYLDALDRIDNPSTKKRLRDGNWEYDDDPSLLMQLQDINACFNRNIQSDDIDNRYITGDVSRKGRDRMTIGLWYGLQLVKVIDLPYSIKSDTEKSADFIMNLALENNVRYDHIILDEDGVGGGVVDKIKGCIGFINNSSPIQNDDYENEQDKNIKQLKRQNYSNLKTQCYYKLANYVGSNKIGITEPNADVRDLIAEELMAVKQKNIDSDGKLEILDKKAMKKELGRSPDFGDMIMMRMWGELKVEPEFMIYEV